MKTENPPAFSHLDSPSSANYEFFDPTWLDKKLILNRPASVMNVLQLMLTYQIFVLKRSTFILNRSVFKMNHCRFIKDLGTRS